MSSRPTKPGHISFTIKMGPGKGKPAPKPAPAPAPATDTAAPKPAPAPATDTVAPKPAPATDTTAPKPVLVPAPATDTATPKPAPATDTAASKPATDAVDTRVQDPLVSCPSTSMSRPSTSLSIASWDNFSTVLSEASITKSPTTEPDVRPLGADEDGISSDLSGEAADHSAAAPSPQSEVLLSKFEQDVHMQDRIVIFLIENRRFTVDRFFFQRDSERLRELFHIAQSGSEELEGSPGYPVIELPHTKALDFARFLDVLYPTDFNSPAFSTVDEWASVMRVAHDWGFASLRALAARPLFSIASSVDKIVYGREFSETKWLVDAYVDLCTRDDTLPLEQAQRLELVDIVHISTLRESIWKGEISDDEVRTAVYDACYSDATGDSMGAHIDSTSEPPEPDSLSPVERAAAKVSCLSARVQRLQEALIRAEESHAEAKAKEAEEEAARAAQAQETDELRRLEDIAQERAETIAGLRAEMAKTVEENAAREEGIHERLRGLEAQLRERDAEIAEAKEAAQGDARLIESLRDDLNRSQASASAINETTTADAKSLVLAALAGARQQAAGEQERAGREVRAWATAKPNEGIAAGMSKKRIKQKKTSTAAVKLQADSVMQAIQEVDRRLMANFA